MIAKTIRVSSEGELEVALAASTATGFTPTLAIVFLSVKQDRQAVAALLAEKGMGVFGATSAGEFIDGTLGEGSIAVMLLDIEPNFFRIHFAETGAAGTYGLAKELGEGGRRAFSHPAFIVASGGLGTDGELLVRGIEEAAGSDTIIFGGMAGDDLTARGTYVFTNGKITGDGVIALILDADKIQVQGLAVSGWKGVGIPRTVTRSENNIVYTIDGKPALDMLAKYMGTSPDLSTENELAVNIDDQYPIQLLRNGAPPVMRTARFLNKADGSIVFGGNVPQGTTIRFSLPPDFDIADKVVEECQALKQTTQPRADAVIMFSCISRLLSLGLIVSQEIERVNAVWNSPLAGFFCYGEIGKAAGGKAEFHNNTCCLVTLRQA